jgi:hypothetical protein
VVTTTGDSRYRRAVGYVEANLRNNLPCTVCPCSGRRTITRSGDSARSSSATSPSIASLLPLVAQILLFLTSVPLEFPRGRVVTNADCIFWGAAPDVARNGRVIGVQTGAGTPGFPRIGDARTSGPIARVPAPKTGGGRDRAAERNVTPRAFAGVATGMLRLGLLFFLSVEAGGGESGGVPRSSSNASSVSDGAGRVEVASGVPICVATRFRVGETTAPTDGRECPVVGTMA